MSWQASPGCSSLCSLLGKTGHPLLLQQYLLALWKLDSNNETSQWISASFLHEEQILISWRYFTLYHQNDEKKHLFKTGFLREQHDFKHRENQFLLTLPRFETWNLFRSQNEKHQDSKSVYWVTNEVWILKLSQNWAAKTQLCCAPNQNPGLSSLWEGSP